MRRESRHGCARARSGRLIGLFVRHPVTPNLLMALMILAGALALGKLNRQYFPEVHDAHVMSP